MEFIVLLLLILLNGLFSMSEIALVSSRKARLEAAAKRGDKKARKAIKVANNPNRFLSAVQVGITLIGILTGIYSGDKISDDLAVYIAQIPSLAAYAENIAITVVLIIVTFLTLVLGELLPKRIGLASPEVIAKMTAGPMDTVARIASPFIWLLTRTTDLLMRALGIKRTKSSEITEEEIRAIIQEGTSSGAIEEIEQDIVENVFHLGERTVGSLMTPRLDINWIDITEPQEESLKLIQESEHKLYPVCEEDLDRVLGVLFIKDLVNVMLRKEPIDLRSLIKTPVYLPENIKAYKALEEMRVRNTSVALVINEYGGVQGLLTVIDIVDTLVNDVTEDLHRDQEIIRRDDGSYFVDAAVPIEEFCMYFEIEPDPESVQDFSTVGGLVLDNAHRLPETGYTFTWYGLTIEVVDLDGARIDKVIVRRDSTEPEEDDEE